MNSEEVIELLNEIQGGVISDKWGEALDCAITAINVMCGNILRAIDSIDLAEASKATNAAIKELEQENSKLKHELKALKEKQLVELDENNVFYMLCDLMKSASIRHLNSNQESDHIETASRISKEIFVRFGTRQIPTVEEIEKCILNVTKITTLNWSNDLAQAIHRLTEGGGK